MMIKEYQKKYPYRVKAVSAINNRIVAGSIIKPDNCSVCGDETDWISAHHENYALPLVVVWLCPPCHKARHKYLKSIGWVDYILPMKEYSLPDNEILPELKTEITRLLNGIRLSDRDMRIVELKAQGLNHRQVGEKLHLSRERIRQILVKIAGKYDMRQIG